MKINALVHLAFNPQNGGEEANLFVGERGGGGADQGELA